MAIARTYAAAELEDGTTYEDVRVVFQDRRQLEKSMKANGWTSDAHTFTITAFLVWHAGKRTGKHALSWTDFLDQVVDCELEQPDLSDGGEADEELTPTETAITG